MASYSTTLLPIVLLSCSLVWLLLWIFVHPLRKIPGPFWARRTSLWKVYHVYRRDSAFAIQRAHEKYGPVIRIGPNHVNFQTRDAIGPIYKAGSSMPKTKFYDAFTALHPNLFSTRDEEFHKMRRRQMSHSFSMATLLKFEGRFGKHLHRLFSNIEQQPEGQVFDLKESVARYAYDVISDLAFEKDLNTQGNPEANELPPIPDHILIGTMYGMVESLLPYSIRIGNKLPIPSLQKLLQSRKLLSQKASEYVNSAIEDHKAGEKETLLDNLLEAKDPSTGAPLTPAEVSSEAFAFLVAGAHTTSATLGLLFYHLLHNRYAAEKLTEELNANVPLYNDGGKEISYSGLESKLPYTMACIKESFRITPVFTMPLPRLVTDPNGVDINGFHIPQGTAVSMISQALHHDPQFWGGDHDQYIPERWLEDAISFNEIMPFGIGHRACIGRNIASINILKVLCALWRNFEIIPVDKYEKLEINSLGVDEKKGPLLCTVRKRQM
ncbi:hypothetical protein TsFJ059_010211 [Trichoderma semiorbis]|uniref:Cytochrome P450 monooxygenase n=1 Tax=Trichoderma semiorbis TaxID=1491008 RepID=A0A9P8HIC5_9HYPO|nr:hypothetical protein TsFJ059_010211 [Trichoderma semiorbis]